MKVPDSGPYDKSVLLFGGSLAVGPKPYTPKPSFP